MPLAETIRLAKTMPLAETIRLAKTMPLAETMYTFSKNYAFS